MAPSTERRRSIPVPEPDLTPREMLRRAAAMRGMLLAGQADCEANKRISDETNEAFVKAGFYRILQPRRFGGYEFDLPTFARVMAEVSRGCPSCGWVVTFTAGHTHVLAKWAEEAQAEAYGRDGEFRSPLSGGQGTATPVEGGYVLNGAWNYASGCDVATHFIASARLAGPGPDAPPGDMYQFLIRRDQFEIVDNWDMLGMVGSGSKCIVVKDLFVPARLARQRLGDPFSLNPADAADEHAQPGFGLFDNPMYAGPSSNVLMCEIAAVAVGTAWGALDAYEEILFRRTMRTDPGQSRADNHEFQRYYGQAFALIRTAEDALAGCTERYMEYCRQDMEEGVRFTAERIQEITLVEQQVTRLCGEAVELLARTGGSTDARPGAVLQRYFRDMATLRTHNTLQYDRLQEVFGRMYLTRRKDELRAAEDA